MPELQQLALDVALTYRLLALCMLLCIAPAVWLLRGRDAADLMCKVTLFTASMILGTWFLCAWKVFTMPLGPYANTWHSGIDRHVTLMIFIVFIAMGGHAFIYACHLFAQNWRTARSRSAVVLYGVAFLLALSSPWPAVAYVRRMDEIVRRLPTYEQAWSDKLTAAWAEEQPHDWSPALLRANFLADEGRHDEARYFYLLAIDLLPEDKAAVREAMMDMLGQTTP